MKILNRPMFRYGGPIKEGIMNGIQEPKRGRVDGPGSYGGDASKVFANVAGGYVKPNFEKMVEADQIQNNQIINKDYLNRKFNKQYLLNEDQRIKTNPMDFQFQYMTPDKYINKVDTLKRDEIMSNPEAKNIFFDEYVAKNYGDKIQEQKSIFEAAGDKRINKVYGNERLVGTSGVPGGGDPEMYSKPTTVAKVLENDTSGLNDGEGDPGTNRQDKVKSILEKLGYARSQKNALYDALIAGGQRISREGLGKTNLVNDLIADTSTAYDKPQKIREAAELMQVQQDLKLEGIDRSKTNLLEENYNFLVNKFGKSTAMAITTKSDKTSDDAYLRLKGLPDVTTNEAVLGAVRSMVDLGEGGIKKEDIRGEISKKKYSDGIDSFKNSSEFNREDKGAGVYVYEGIVIEIDANGKHEVIKTFGSINDKAKKWLGMF